MASVPTQQPTGRTGMRRETDVAGVYSDLGRKQVGAGRTNYPYENGMQKRVSFGSLADFISDAPSWGEILCKRFGREVDYKIHHSGCSRLHWI